MDKNFPRLLETLRLLPSGRKATAPEIHQRLQALGYAVSRRTVERDLEALAEHYGIECDQRSKPFGWGWPSKMVRPVLGVLDIQQALALEMMQRECADIIPPAAREALQPWFDAAARSMKNAGHTLAAKWAAKVAVQPIGPPLQAARVARAVMDGVSEALFSERQISAEYRAKHKEIFSKVHLHPLGLIRTGLVTYLVAMFEGYNDPRLLAMHRLKHVRLLAGRASKPTGFDLERYVKAGALDFGGGKTIKLKLRMSTKAAEHLGETPLADDQAISATGNGQVTVTATVTDSPRLIWWLKGFGKDVEVMSPPRYLDSK